MIACRSRRSFLTPKSAQIACIVIAALFGSIPAWPAEPLVLRQTLTVSPGDVRVLRHRDVDFIILRGGATFAPEGAPDIPALPVTFRLPEDMKIESVAVQVLESQALRGRFKLNPVHTENSDHEFNPAPPVTPVLDQAGFYPAELGQVGASGRMRGRVLGGVVVTPFRYRAADGRLELITRAELQVRLKPVTRDKSLDFLPLRREPWAESTFGRLAERLAINGSAGLRAADGGNLKPLINSGGPFEPTYRPSVNGSPVEMVIITNETQQSQYQRLADWKTRSGIPTVVRTVSWIKANYPNGVDTQETVRNFIRDAAQKWGTIWVLLGGDTDVIPTRYGRTLFFGGEEIPTDLYYQCLDGNWNANGNAEFGEGYGSVSQPGDNADLYPEVWVGRCPTVKAAEAQAVVDKILAYQSTPLTNGYQKTFLGLAEVLFPQLWTYGDSVLFDGADVVETAIAFLPPWWQVAKLYENCPNVKWPTCVLEYKPTVLDSINAGFGIVHHVGHGYINTMSVGQYEFALGNADADAASNGAETSFLYAINCTSSAIDFNCIAERYFLNPNGGSVASMGSTRFDFPSTGWSYQDEFYRLVFQQGITALGHAEAASKLPFIPLALQDNTHRWTQFTQIYFGDPSTDLYTDAAAAMVVAHGGTYTLGSGTYAVTVTDGVTPIQSARVCLNKPNDEYVVGYTNASGVATLPFVPDSTGTFQVTVVAHNFRPHLGSATVVASVAAYLYAQSQMIDDDSTPPSSGNSDGKIDAGETIEIKLPLKNRGGSTSSSVVATLTSLSPYVIVSDSTSTYGTIGAGATVTPSDAIVFNVPRSAPDRTEAKVRMTYRWGVDSIQEDVILYVHAPIFQWYRQFVRDTTGTGNSNGIVGPGEDITLRVELRNGGLGQAQAVVGKLRSTDPVFTISDSVVVFGTIAGGVRAVAMPNPDTFRFQMSDTTGLSVNAHRMTVYIFDQYSAATPLAAFPVDPKGPAAAVTNIVARGSTSSIALTFSPSTAGDVYGYNVYRSSALAGPYSRVNQYTTDKSSYYNDEGLPGLTIFYYKAAAQDSSGNEGPLSVATSASTTVPLGSGFPVETKGATNASVTLADVDYDGNLDIMASGTEIYALHPDGSEVYDGDADVRTLGPITNTGCSGFWNAPTVGDMNRDGSPEVAAVCWNANLYLWDQHGVVQPGFPRNLNILNQTDPNPLGSVAMGDVDGDGNLEMFALMSKHLFGFRQNGTEIVDGDSNPATIGVFKATGVGYSYGTPALADMNNDGRPEVIASFRDGTVHVMNGLTGVDLPGWPFVTAGDNTSSPGVADINNDGQPEIVVAVSNPVNKVYVLKANGTNATGWPQGLALAEDLDSSPALGDLTGDGIPDIVCGASNGRIYAWRNDGVVLPGWPVFIRDNLGVNVAVRSSPALVDIDNDGTPEIIFGDQIGRLHCLRANGQAVAGFPIQTGALIEGGPAAWDIDRDGMTEVVVQSFDQKIYLWKTPWTFNKLASPWPMFHHDPRHTGSLREPLYYQTAVPEAPAIAAKPFILHQNQPNPFNPVTTIRYQIQSTESSGGSLPVRLEVFSSTGRLIKVLVDRPMPSGDYEVGWDGTDSQGSHAASGIYFYTITTPRGSESRKMAMIR